MNQFLATLKARHLGKTGGGIFAVCSAHPLVLQTAMETAAAANRPLLIEATANQVNQDGGYTGMTPADFVTMVRQTARTAGLPSEQLILGADHLGPHIWSDRSLDAAMEKARSLITLCVASGFQKIHLDAGMSGESTSGRRSLTAAAGRAAQLCLAAELAVSAGGTTDLPMYVIGDEVPPPGGGLLEGTSITVTSTDQVHQTIEVFRQAFHQAGLNSAWERVVALVVQPGVEFGDRQVAHYQPALAEELSAAHAHLPGCMTYEVHATDYQTEQALHRMVDDHFTILKVGPCLTFAMRRALYGLARIESALGDFPVPSRLPQVMERLMNEKPAHWQSHYKGDVQAVNDMKHNSLRDRIRYYWSHCEAGSAVDRLLSNLRLKLPDDLIHEHLPDLYADIVLHQYQADPESIVKLSIRKAIAAYTASCWRTQT